MEEIASNYTNAEATKPLTLDELKKAAAKIVVGSTSTGKPKTWFERVMNRWGWYRSSEWYILRESQFHLWPRYGRPPISDLKSNIV